MVRTITAIMIILACFALVAVALLIKGHSGRRSRIAPQNTAQAANSEKLTFQGTFITNGKNEEGARVFSEYFRSSDCIPISKRITFYQSPTRAQQEIERITTKASTVIESGPLPEGNRRPQGERVVLHFETSEKNRAHTEIIWTEDSSFYSIGALSLHHAIEFEKSMRMGDGRILVGLPAVHDVVFDPIGVLDGRTEKGSAYSEKQFKSSYCEKITTRTEYFESPERAHQELEDKIKASINLIERGPKLDEQGQQIGDRAVLVLEPTAPDEILDKTAVIWTERSKLHSITGASFQYVLEFERRASR